MWEALNFYEHRPMLVQLFYVREKLVLSGLVYAGDEQGSAYFALSGYLFHPGSSFSSFL